MRVCMLSDQELWAHAHDSVGRLYSVERAGGRGVPNGFESKLERTVRCAISESCQCSRRGEGWLSPRQVEHLKEHTISFSQL